MIGFPLSVIGSKRPINWISHIFWLKPLKPGFLRFEEQVPFKIKKENIGGSMRKEDLSIDITSTPVSFHWIVPLVPLVVIPKIPPYTIEYGGSKLRTFFFSFLMKFIKYILNCL